MNTKPAAALNIYPTCLCKNSAKKTLNAETENLKKSLCARDKKQKTALVMAVILGP